MLSKTIETAIIDRCSCYAFVFEGENLVLITPVPDHYLTFCFSVQKSFCFSVQKSFCFSVQK